MRRRRHGCAGHGPVLHGQLGRTVVSTTGELIDAVSNHYITTPSMLPNVTDVKLVEAGSTYTLLYTSEDASVITSLGRFSLTSPIENQYPQMTPDTGYATQIVTATRTWTKYQVPGWVGSVSQATKPDIDVWRSYDTVRENYGGHNWRYSVNAER